MITFLFLLLIVSDFKVSKLTILGNEYLKEPEIKSIMLTKTPSIFRKGTFNHEIFAGDIIAIKNLYRYKGFHEIEVDHELIIDSLRQHIEIIINIKEGDQTFVETIRFTGNIIFNDSTLKKMIVTKCNEPFDKRTADLDQYILASVYDNIGYADAVVQPDYHIDDHKAHITYTIIENDKQFVQNIEFSGLKRTKEEILQDEIALKNGDVFRYANVLKSQRDLYNLGIFKTIKTHIKNAAIPNHKIVQFYLGEKKAVKYYFRIGYGTRDYLRFGAGVTHLNLFERAWQGKIDGKLSFAEYRLISQLAFPRLIVLPLNINIDVFYQFKKEIGFRIRNFGGNLTTYFRVLQGTFSTKYEIERIRTYYPDGVRNTDDWIQGLTFNWLKDQRNDPLFTKTGDYLNILFETGGIIFASDVDYLKLTFDYRLYKPIISSIGAVSFKTGIVQPVSPTLEVPVYKRFFCGGTSSVRGYSEWSIGPTDISNNPLGGKILAEVSGELRIPIHRILGCVIFVDAGNVWSEYSNVSRDLRYGAGVGLRLKTPLGSIRFDYGLKIDRQPNESTGTLHFAIGEAF